MSSAQPISVRAAAEILGKRYGQVIRMIRSKKLKARKAEGGWGWLIDRADVEAEAIKPCNPQ